MKRTAYSVLVVLVGLLIYGQGATAAKSEFRFVSESATYDSSTGNVQFQIVFNQKPDFVTTDSFGRQTNSFQYFIVGDSSLPYPANFDSIIRGEEIHLSGLIPIRNATPEDLSDPNSGGWGPVVGAVSYTLHGNNLTFSVPLELISVHRDAVVRYQLESYQAGVLTTSAASSIRSTP